MAQFIERALVTLDTSSGQVLLEDVSEFSVEAPRNYSAVKTMNRLGRVRGHRGGPPEVTASMTVQNALLKEADLFALWRKEEVFLLTFEEAPGSGDRYQLPQCKIDSINRSYNAEGEAQLEVSIVAVDLVRIPR